MKRKSSKFKTTAIANQKERDVDLIDDDFSISESILADPRKALFMQLYFDRESPTFGNMKQSAIAAGFSEEYAHNITALKPKWLYDFIGQLDFVNLAETHLKEVLMLPNVMQAMGAFGPIYKSETIKVQKQYKNGKTKMINKKIKIPVMVPNTSVIKEKTLAAKIVLPAHDGKYAKNDGPKVKFNFNLGNLKDEYK